MNIQSYPALVLNADYAPVSVYPLSTWGFERTLRNFLKDRITVLEEYDAVLRSPSFEYNPPSVIALKDFVKRPQRVSFNRLNIFLRDDFTCQYCQKKHESHNLTFDHVIPRAAGGKTNFNNIVACCIPCNVKKGSHTHMKPIRSPKTPSPRDLARLNTPRKQLHASWLDYLYWSGVLEQEGD